MNKGRIILIILVVAILAAGLIYFNRGSNSVGKQTIYDINPGQLCSFFRTDGGLAVVNQEGLTVVNPSGGTEAEFIRPYANPMFSENNGHMLLYDKNGTSLTYYHGNSKKHELTTDLPIITAKVNSTGYAAVATMETGYRGKLEVYDRSGEPVYKWKIGNSYIVDMDVSPDCKKIGAVLLNTSGAVVGSRFVIIDIDKAEIIYDEEITNCMPYQVKCSRGSLVILTTDTGVIAYSYSGSKKWQYGYDDKILESFIICDDGAGMFKFSGASNNSIVELYDTAGKKCGEYVSDGRLVSVDADKTAVVVAGIHNITVIGWNGSKKTTFRTDKDIRSVVMLNSGTAAVIGSGSAEAYKF